MRTRSHRPGWPSSAEAAVRAAAAGDAVALRAARHGRRTCWRLTVRALEPADRRTAGGRPAGCSARGGPLLARVTARLARVGLQVYPVPDGPGRGGARPRPALSPLPAPSPRATRVPSGKGVPLPGRGAAHACRGGRLRPKGRGRTARPCRPPGCSVPVGPAPRVGSSDHRRSTVSTKLRAITGAAALSRRRNRRAVTAGWFNVSSKPQHGLDEPARGPGHGRRTAQRRDASPTRGAPPSSGPSRPTRTPSPPPDGSSPTAWPPTG